MRYHKVIEKIKKLRATKGLSLGQLSNLTGLSKGYLSKVENAVSIPSINALHKIVTALEVDLVQVFSENHLDQLKNKITVCRRNEKKSSFIRESNIKFSPLADLKFGRNMDPYIVELPHDHDWVFQFEGEEFNYILEGKIELRYGDEHLILEKGDGVYIDGDIPYSAKSIGDKPAKILSTIYRYKKIVGEPFSDGMLPNVFKFNKSSKK